MTKRNDPPSALVLWQSLGQIKVDHGQLIWYKDAIRSVTELKMSSSALGKAVKGMQNLVQ